MLRISTCAYSVQKALLILLLIIPYFHTSAPDAVDFLNLLGTNFTSYYDSIGFNWKQYAGSKVLTIGGLPAYSYVDHIASTVSGNCERSPCLPLSLLAAHFVCQILITVSESTQYSPHTVSRPTSGVSVWVTLSVPSPSN